MSPRNVKDLLKMRNAVDSIRNRKSSRDSDRGVTSMLANQKQVPTPTNKRSAKKLPSKGEDSF